MSSAGGARARRGAQAWRLVRAACVLVLAVALFERPLAITWGGGEPGGTGTLARIAERVGFGGATRGFHVQVLSSPVGGRVAIAGRYRGEAPFFGNVPCRDGDEITLEVTAKDFRPWVRKVHCREGGTLEVKARLEPASGS